MFWRERNIWSAITWSAIVVVAPKLESCSAWRLVSLWDFDLVFLWPWALAIYWMKKSVFVRTTHFFDFIALAFRYNVSFYHYINTIYINYYKYPRVLKNEDSIMFSSLTFTFLRYCTSNWYVEFAFEYPSTNLKYSLGEWKVKGITLTYCLTIVWVHQI